MLKPTQIRPVRFLIIIVKMLCSNSYDRCKGMQDLLFIVEMNNLKVCADEYHFERMDYSNKDSSINWFVYFL